MTNSSIDILSKIMTASTIRHKVHSNNIANINTPNYKRQIVSFEEELRKAVSTNKDTLPLKITNNRHIGSSLNIEPTVLEDKTTSMRTDNNNVDLDLELALLAENTIKFNVLTQSLSQQFGLLRSAIRGGR